MKLWQQILVRQVAGIWGVFLGALWLVYVVVDLSTHGMGISREIVFYYVANFVIYLDFFISLSFLLALLKVLLDLNAHGELAALQMAGISKKKMMAPLFALAGLLALLSLSSGEWLSPWAHKRVDQFWSKHDRKKKVLDEHLHCVVLEDTSELLYQRYHPDKQQLYDVLWLRSKEEIWRIAHLGLQTRLGIEVERFVRKEGGWKREGVFPERLMEEIVLGKGVSLKRFVPFSNRSISSLFQQLWSHLPDRSVAKAHFFYRIARPMICFFCPVCSCACGDSI